MTSYRACIAALDVAENDEARHTARVAAAVVWCHSARKHRTPALPVLSVQRILTRRLGHHMTAQAVLDACARVGVGVHDGVVDVRNKSAL